MPRASGAFIFLLAITPAIAPACDMVVIGNGNEKVDVAGDIVREADVIVRATAVEYASRTLNLKSPIRFKVDEVIRGKDLPSELILPGELVSQDDFNLRSPPYDVVRSNGLKGTCYAWQYRTDAQYLLMLKRNAGGFTAEWSPLSPVNEQLHSAHDPWLFWVRLKVSDQEQKRLP